MKLNIFYIMCLISTMLIACGSSYDKKVVGTYRIADYAPDSIRVEDILSLDLRKNKSFTLIFNQTSKSGKWEAGDNGDRTWIRFHFDSGNTSDA